MPGRLPGLPLLLGLASPGSRRVSTRPAESGCSSAGHRSPAATSPAVDPASLAAARRTAAASPPAAASRGSGRSRPPTSSISRPEQPAGPSRTAPGRSFDLGHQVGETASTCFGVGELSGNAAEDGTGVASYRPADSAARPPDRRCPAVAVSISFASSASSWSYLRSAPSPFARERPRLSFVQFLLGRARSQPTSLHELRRARSASAGPACRPARPGPGGWRAACGPSPGSSPGCSGRAARCASGRRCRGVRVEDVICCSMSSKFPPPVLTLIIRCHFASNGRPAISPRPGAGLGPRGRRPACTSFWSALPGRVLDDLAGRLGVAAEDDPLRPVVDHRRTRGLAGIWTTVRPLPGR